MSAGAGDVIVFACPACRSKYRCPVEKAGQLTKCANQSCGARLRIPCPIPTPKPEPVDGMLLDTETGAKVGDWKDVPSPPKVLADPLPVVSDPPEPRRGSPTPRSRVEHDERPYRHRRDKGASGKGGSPARVLGLIGLLVCVIFAVVFSVNSKTSSRAPALWPPPPLPDNAKCFWCGHEFRTKSDPRCSIVDEVNTWVPCPSGCGMKLQVSNAIDHLESHKIRTGRR